MSRRSRTELGLSLIAIAVGLMFASLLAADLVLLVAGLDWAWSLSASTRIAIAVTLGLVYPAAAFAIGIAGLHTVWRGQAEGKWRASHSLSIARISGLIGLAAFAGLLIVGLLVSVARTESVASVLQIGGGIIRAVGAIAVGLSLLFGVRDLASPVVARVSILALALGLAAVISSLAWTVYRLPEPLAVAWFPYWIGWAERLSAVASLGAWLFVYVATLARLRMPPGTPASAVPVGPQFAESRF